MILFNRIFRAVLKLLPLYLTLFMAIGSSLQASSSSSPVVREHVLVQLQSAQKLIDLKDYEQSFLLLSELNKGDLSQYEHSQVYLLLAFQFFQLNKTQGAIAQYEKILHLRKIPELTRKQTQYNLAQLYFSIESYAAANKTLQAWFENQSAAGVDAYELYGQINYSIENYPVAIEAIDTAIKIQRSNHKSPKRNWLQLLQVMHYAMGNFTLTLEAVETLIKLYPRKTYWLQLAGIHAELGHSKQQLAVMDAAYLQGYLENESELKTLAYLYLEQRVPYKAAKVLDWGLRSNIIKATEKNQILLASAWHLAREIDRAILTTEQAAVKSNAGNLYAELGQLFLSARQYDKAISACQSAINIGQLQKPGQTYNTLGIALFKQNYFSQATAAFKKAKGYPKAIKVALLWEKHIKQMQVR